jgi:hypothetical protein
MSNALAIPGVTAVLRHFLNSVYNNVNSVLGSVTVSAKAPDVVQTELGTGNNAPLLVNLFLHQVTPNAAWRNIGLPSLASDGITVLKNQPLALDLHYLLTAYATEDSHAEALLSYAVAFLHDNAIFPRGQITAALTALPSNPFCDGLRASGLADQFEMIKVTPATLGREEMAWLWTALKADYRPTFPFQVTVVLIEQQFATSFALPVLSRSITAQASAPPQILDVQLPTGQTSAAQGQSVTVTGVWLAGASLVALTNSRLGIYYPVTPTAATNTSVTFTVPTDAANLPAGVYNLSILFTNAKGDIVLSTNTLPMGVAPTVSGTPQTLNNSAGTLVTINCAPNVRQSQSASLALGSTAAPAQTFNALQVSSLTFQFPTLVSGQYLIRLRVDGVDSPVTVNWKAMPPVFTGPWLTI